MVLSAVVAAVMAVQSPPTEIRGGLWWDGESFRPQTRYVADGVFVPEAAVEEADVIDLGGAHVVPPYCDAHAHSMGRSPAVPEIVDDYLTDGVFYVRILGDYPPYREALLEGFSSIRHPDVAFAGAPVTAPGGHPVEVYQRLHAHAGLFQEFEWDALSGRAFFEIADAAELAEAWPDILAGAPDAIKVHLLYSEHYEQRRDHPDTAGQRGFDPALLPDLVARADAAGLPVIAHVETAADFRSAIAAGVTEIAHLPGYNGPSAGPYTRELTPEDAVLAAQRRARVHTTLSYAERLRARAPDRFAAAQAVQRHNLELLREAGVGLIVGGDNYADTSADEVRYLAALDVFDPAELLNMWGRDCAQAVFPDRAIGSLEDGAEASFLVLGGDPLDDFAHAFDIRQSMQRGDWLDP